MYPDQQDPQNNQPPDNGNDIFRVQPTPPPTSSEKKRTALWITISLIIGFAILIAVAFFTLFLWANSAADRYRGGTELHVAMLAGELEEIDIESILNRRDTTELQELVQQHVAERPVLDAVILAETTSVSYQSTVEMQVRIDEYYTKVVSFVDSLPTLLEFSQAIERADNDLTELLEDRPPETPGAARTVAGSIDNIASALEGTETPEALVAFRDELSAAYRQLGEGYRDLATAYEGTEISQAQADRRIDAARRSITTLNQTDLTEEVQGYRDNLVLEAETLLSQL